MDKKQINWMECEWICWDETNIMGWNYESYKWDEKDWIE